MHQCHIKLVFTNVGTKCADCHADIHRRQFGANCEQCHTVRGGKSRCRRFRQHNNRFPLTERTPQWTATPATRARPPANFRGMSTQCYSCHAADFKGTSKPEPRPGGSPRSASRATDGHLAERDFRPFVGWISLSGGHAVTAAPVRRLPHQQQLQLIQHGLRRAATSRTIRDTTNPNHVAASFSQTCKQCHNTTSWSNASFNHNATGFPLTGMRTVPPRQCIDCHVNNNYNLTQHSLRHLPFEGLPGTRRIRITCTSNFPQGCDQCHNTTRG